MSRSVEDVVGSVLRLRVWVPAAALLLLGAVVVAVASPGRPAWTVVLVGASLLVAVVGSARWVIGRIERLTDPVRRGARGAARIAERFDGVAAEVLDTHRAAVSAEARLSEVLGSVRDLQTDLGRPADAADGEASTVFQLLQRIGGGQRRAEVVDRRRADADFRQIQALFALHGALDSDVPVPPLRSWALSPDVTSWLVGEVLARPGCRVLEVGSGSSSVFVGLAAARVGGSVISLEHEAEYLDRSRELVARAGLADLVDVVHAPLVDQQVGDQVYSWYDLSDVPNGPIDVLIVDGPPGGTGQHARYPALPLLVDRLTPRAVVVLDDADREQEREVAERWREELGFALEVLPHEKGTAVLRRATSTDPR